MVGIDENRNTIAFIDTPAASFFLSNPAESSFVSPVMTVADQPLAVDCDLGGVIEFTLRQTRPMAAPVSVSQTGRTQGDTYRRLRHLAGRIDNRPATSHSPADNIHLQWPFIDGILPHLADHSQLSQGIR